MVEKFIQKAIVKFPEGNGFIITNDGVAFTCYHVIEDYLDFNEIPCNIGDEDCLAKIIPNTKNIPNFWKTLDFALVQIFHKNKKLKDFVSIPIGLEPTGIDQTKKYEIYYYDNGNIEPEPAKNLNPYYRNEKGLNYLKYESDVESGLSGSPLYDYQLKGVIGVVIRQNLKDIRDATRRRVSPIKTKIYGIAVPMSLIIKSILKSEIEIPPSLLTVIEQMKEDIPRLETIFFPAFNEYNLNLRLFSENPERFRSEGPHLVDFERGDWVYVPKISHEISKMILDGKVVILGGKPATGKSVISRYIGYEFTKEKQVAVYYIDFPDLAPEDIKDLIKNLKEIINSTYFKTLKKDNYSPLFIFENIHDPQLNKDQLREKRLIPSLIALKEKVKILITTRSELVAFKWIDEKNRINLDNLLGINKEIINGIVDKFNKNRKYPIKWEYQDSIDNLWILGWYLRVIEDSQDQEFIFADSKKLNEKLKELIKFYYEENFPEFHIELIITILLIFSVLSRYETPIEEEFIIEYVISKFQGLDKNIAKQIIDILEGKREIISKKIENLKDMSSVSFEYRIPHIKLAEILQDIYLNEYNKEKFETIFIDYIQKGKNTEILGHNLWIQEKFQLALKSFKLNKVEEDLIKKYLKYCNFEIKVSKGHVHDLDFDNSLLRDIPENLHYFSELKILVLTGNQISTIQRLEKLHNLERLHLGGNQISEIQGLEKLHNLQELYLFNNHISEIQGLEELHNLERLHLGINQISEIQRLEDLHNLQELYLLINQISTIQGLEKLQNLQELSLNNNQISTIQRLEKLQKLEKLNLGYNQISEIQGLEKLQNLERLHLGSNQISEIQRLEKLQNLQELHLDCNQISEIQGLEHLYNLQLYDLRQNPIQENEINIIYLPAQEIVKYCQEKKLKSNFILGI